MRFRHRNLIVALGAVLLVHQCTGATLPSASAQDLVIVARFQHLAANETVQAMRQELELVVASVGLQVEWVISQEQVEIPSSPILVIVSFRGGCEVTMKTPHNRLEYAKKSALAQTQMTNGKFDHFVVLECDRIASLVQPLLGFRKRDIPNEQFGRAMARVLAHELYHILADTPTHGTSGITQASLSPIQLVGKRLQFSKQDVERMRSMVTGRRATHALGRSEVSSSP